MTDQRPGHLHPAPAAAAAATMQQEFIVAATPPVVGPGIRSLQIVACLGGHGLASRMAQLAQESAREAEATDGDTTGLGDEQDLADGPSGAPLPLPWPVGRRADEP